MDNYTRVYHYFLKNQGELNKSGVFYKMVKRAADKFIAERGW
jgi:hypothetical protein